MRHNWGTHPHPAGPVLHRGRGWIAAMALLLALAVLARARVSLGATPLPVATTTLDPRLIVRAHTVQIAGTLGSYSVHGTLYPGLPGGNMVRIRVGGAGTPAPAPYLSLVVTMPGMPMIPVTAMLPARGGAYSGLIPLPMFGSYTASLTLTRGGVRQHGTARLSVPLYLGHE